MLPVYLEARQWQSQMEASPAAGPLEAKPTRVHQSIKLCPPLSCQDARDYVSMMMAHRSGNTASYHK